MIVLRPIEKKYNLEGTVASKPYQIVLTEKKSDNEWFRFPYKLPFKLIQTITTHFPYKLPFKLK